MGIQVEFNPDLALRRHGTPGREDYECIPEDMKEGVTYHFLKEGQRNYCLDETIPLVETEGEGKLSRPLASITILEATHFLSQLSKKVYTRGLYKIIRVFDPKDPTVHFEAMREVR